MIHILLATYNSHDFLGEQLDSLLKQDHQDFQILIRDGGSADDTLEIIREYQGKFPEKIRFLGGGKASVVENFSLLLENSGAELVMFCDHDDVWLPHKVSHTLRKYREMEAACGPRTPIMVFTDSFVADRKLKMIARSMLRYQRLDATRLTLARLISQNVPSGNTLLVNRALIDLAVPIPPEAVMHDHWFALVAAGLGRIGFLDEPTLCYRQHEGNVYGAFRYSVFAFLKKLGEGRGKLRQRFEQNIDQAAAFGRRYADRLSAGDRAMCDDLASWPQLGFWARRRVLLKYRIFKSGFWRTLGTFLFV